MERDPRAEGADSGEEHCGVTMPDDAAEVRTAKSGARCLCAVPGLLDNL